jgi:type I restriction enzyme, R subunit
VGEAQEYRYDNIYPKCSFVGLRANPMRITYADKLREVIDRYSSDAANIEVFFAELKELTGSLTEEELTVFDLLAKPEPKLTKSEEANVKKVVRELLEKLKQEVLVLDWKKHQATRAAVQVAIKDILDDGLPDVYDRPMFSNKTGAIFEHVFTAYQGNGKSIYEEAA